MKTRVRFHLGAGRHFMKWQVSRGRRVRYLDPASVSLEMTNCRLVNRRSMADRIHGGANKTPCAWVACDDVRIRAAGNAPAGEQIRFNPRVAPHWMGGGSGENRDGAQYQAIRTSGRQLYGA